MRKSPLLRTPLFLVFFQGFGSQLQRVDAPFSIQLLTNNCIDHSMTSGLRLRLERLGDDVEPILTRRSVRHFVDSGALTNLKWVSLEVFFTIA